MAQRFGGKFSPDKNGSPQTGAPALRPRVDPVGARANLMFAPAAIVLFTSLASGAAGLALGASSAAILALSAWLLRDGLRAEAAYNERKVARRPGIPRKLFSSVLAGAGIALASLSGDGGLIAAALYGAVTTGLHMMSFGFDPMRDKGMEGIDTFQQDRARRTVDKAEGLLAQMADAIRRAGDRRAEARVERFQATVRDMLRTIEEDPRDLTSARRYTGVYLMGARDATIKFADIYARSGDDAARTKYMALLDDLEANFAAKTQTLLQDDQGDLAIEISVLRDRLEREGVALPQTPPPLQEDR
ncbi:5-bromo-4-chloroindolyl phosphate hydrolysis family protein [Roseovarius dicentrarchi]|uniref:5-bromo-4-chloroindolyl phosphate hydrolysis family protein n=1 Tax=Roseovarius dicentrarchi TaxID=2250573 RepID=UPI000DEA7636|nr:5-bromo-4-chloroindolyl phosphate hydrolysis family protein [Roseovarius dicentrarchi]